VGEEPRAAAPGPPPLTPFGLMLHHDGRWSHEGAPLQNRKLRALFDRSVRYLLGEQKFVVQVQRFRGEIEVQEAAFFVRDFEPCSGEIALSDGSREPLDVASLGVSPLDGALLCRIKRDLVAEGLLARFHHAAHADFLGTVEAAADGMAARIAGELHRLPPL
jgi:hypothetical protein